MTKIRDDGCIPSIEAEEDPLLNHLLIAMLCVGVVILLLIIVLLFVLFKKKPKRVTILLSLIHISLITHGHYRRFKKWLIIIGMAIS